MLPNTTKWKFVYKLRFCRGLISSFHKGTQPQSYISGQISTYSDIEFSFLDMVIILFQPIGCKMFFPYPMEEFTNQNIGIDLLDNTCLVELEEKINEASDNYQIVRLIEEYLLNRLSKIFHVMPIG